MAWFLDDQTGQNSEQIERRTSNVQHRIMYSVNFKKNTEQSESTLGNSIRFSRSTLSLDTEALDRQNTLFDVGRSTFDVRCSFFS